MGKMLAGHFFLCPLYLACRWLSSHCVLTWSFLLANAFLVSLPLPIKTSVLLYEGFVLPALLEHKGLCQPIKLYSETLGIQERGHWPRDREEDWKQNWGSWLYEPVSSLGRWVYTMPRWLLDGKFHMLSWWNMSSRDLCQIEDPLSLSRSLSTISFQRNKTNLKKLLTDIA